MFAATAVIEDGQAMLVMGGGGADNHIHYTTQIVRLCYHHRGNETQQS